MVEVDFKLTGRGFRHRAVRRDQLELGDLIDFVQHVGKVVEVVDGVNLTLGIAIAGSRRARRLQVAFRVALAVK